MKKCIYTILIAVFALSPVQLYAQDKMSKNVEVKRKETGNNKNEEYSQSQILSIRRHFFQHAQQTAANQQQERQPGPRVRVNPDGFGSKGIVNAFLFQTRIGFTSVYTHRISQNLYFVGEFGYFTNSQNRARSSLYDRITGFYNRARGDLYEVELWPVYGGLRRGVVLKNSLKRFYPYIGAGAGPVLGRGYVRNMLVTDTIYRLVPSAYAIVGTEIYATGKWFLDLSIRYRYLTFSRYLANWKSFSGVTFNFGFGYGIGQQVLR